MNLFAALKELVFAREGVPVAIDVVAVERDDGTMRSTPFRVCFAPTEEESLRPVLIEVNGRRVDGVTMLLDQHGDAFFADDEMEKEENPDLFASPSVNGKMTKFPARSPSQATTVSDGSPDPMAFADWLESCRSSLVLSPTAESPNDEEEETRPERAASSGGWFNWWSTPAVPMEAQATSPKKHKSISQRRRRPTQKQLDDLELVHGLNTIEFVVHTRDGVKRAAARLFLWPVSTKLVLVDLDGAISQVTRRGSRMVSNDRSIHAAALDFFTQLTANGYRVVCLANRRPAYVTHSPVLPPIDGRDAPWYEGMADATAVCVPTLESLRTLFPIDVNPFYGAFTTSRATGVMMIDAGVFRGKIFLVDEHAGSVRHWNMRHFRETYAGLKDRVDNMFPPLNTAPPSRRCNLAASLPPASSSTSAGTDVYSTQLRTRSMQDEAYNDVNYWRIQPKQVVEC